MLSAACFGATDRAGLFLSETGLGAASFTRTLGTTSFCTISSTATTGRTTRAKGKSGNGNDRHQGQALDYFFHIFSRICF